MKNLRHKLGILTLMLVTFATTVTHADTVRLSRVQAHDTDVWTVPVVGGELVTIVVEGDGDTDVDLFVRQNGVLLGKDDDDTDYCVVRVRARRSGQLKLEIANLGNVYNEYRLSIRR